MKLQKKLLVAAIATAIAGASGSAFAGTASATYNTYAVEALPGLTAVTLPANAYQTGVLIANGTVFTLAVQLSGGATWKNAYAAADITLTGATTGTPVISSSDPSVLLVPFTATANIPSGSVISFAAGGSDTVNLSGLTATGSVTATYAIVNGNPGTAAGFPTTGVLDSASGTIATVAEALSGAIVPSSSFPIAKGSFIPALAADFGVAETQQIDVGAATPFTLFTTGANSGNTNTIDLGAFYINEVPGNQLDAAGNDYTLGLDTNNVTATMTGNFPKGATFKVVMNDATCAGAAVGTATLNSALNAVTIKLGGNAAKGTPYAICETVPGNVVIPATTPQLTAFTVVGIAPNSNFTLPSTALDAETLNGASVTLINYVPAAAAPYETYVRVANNSSLSGSVTVSVKGANGTTLGSGVLGTLAAGASATYTASQVEAAAGVSLTATQRPQITLTAPVPAGDLNAQAFLSDASGGFTNMTSNK